MAGVGRMAGGPISDWLARAGLVGRQLSNALAVRGAAASLGHLNTGYMPQNCGCPRCLSVERPKLKGVRPQVCDGEDIVEPSDLAALHEAGMLATQGFKVRGGLRCASARI